LSVEATFLAKMERPKIRIGSRKSALALVQTREIQSILQQAHPQYQFDIVETSTLGDDVLNKSLAELGSASPGLFTKSLEVGSAASCR
jgi:hydroxymethylbilane synthase